MNNAAQETTTGRETASVPGRVQVIGDGESVGAGSVPNTVQGPRKGYWPKGTGEAWKAAREAQAEQVKEKHAAFQLLVEQGVDKIKAAEMIGYSKNRAYALVKKIKGSEKNSLLSTRRIKKATRTIDAFIEGKQVGGEIDPATGKIVGGISPKCSTVLAAANVVLDRAYPKAQEDSGKGNISFTTINIELMRMPSDGAINPPVDISPSNTTVIDGNE